MLERPSKEAWESWLRSGVTQFYLTDLQDVRESLKEAIVLGQVGLEDQLVGTIGVCSGLQRAIDIARSEFNFSGRQEITEEGETENGN